ncbi:hypothetical protein L484_018200 [Morus notabilis]|uniref:Uncharacterized protein n=1 Tax=Morus notabilis TaxID=981085 RepID=W9R1B8_9ROSA|nr:hypothetical protein L484_018200 [Morus notabilis]
MSCNTSRHDCLHYRPGKAEEIEQWKGIMNIGEEIPNSKISFSYLCNTSSSANLVVIMNTELENPSLLRMVSMNAKR